MLKDGDSPKQRPKPGDLASRRARFERAAAILSVVAIALAMLFAGLFEPAEHRLTTLRAELLSRPPSGQVAIVEIDAKTLAKMNTWPWSRRYHAQALDRLHSARAAMVAFDVDFSASSDVDGDLAFARSLDRNGLTILPTFQQSASNGLSNEVIKTKPAELFRSAWVGGVNILPGPDGVVRDYPAATMIDGRIQPSMAVLLAENDRFGDRMFQPDWGIDARQIPRFSFVDVVNGRVPREAIAGKRILIGATAIELGDRYTIPRFGTMPGVVVQALAAESLLQGRALTRSGILTALLGVLLTALALGVDLGGRFARRFPIQAAAVVIAILAIPIAVQTWWPVSIDSAASLFCALGCVASRVAIEIRRRHREMGLIDGESGLPNGRALEARLVELGLAPVVLVAGSIDRFEIIRDAIGSRALAEVVREVSTRIEGVTSARIYRIGPDSLAWIGVNSEHASYVSKIAEAFIEPVQTTEGPVDVHLTIGLDDEPASENVCAKVERSVAAITMARAAGEDWQWYHSVDPNIRRQLSLMGELRQAMRRGDVKIAYQPKLDLRSGMIAEAEALVRWDHPQQGAIAPDQFVPLAESTGVVRELTAYVLAQVLADCATMKREGRQICVAVNVSAADIGRGEFVREIADLIESSKIDPSFLALEVTESAILGSPRKAIEELTALRRMGVKLSVDDYGTGQSTLSYLKQLPVTELKIDKSFVSSMCENENDRIMVRSTIDLAHELGMKVVAEGVEDATTLEALRSLGCDFAQGYFISKAVHLDMLIALARNHSQLRVA
jgi:EAL domain-containing protein (putative c-di-GMP-specific phosphodiesterase class I)/CHASE2 domain-containing sensor protein